MNKGVEIEFWREKSQLDSQAMKPVDGKCCWYPASLRAPANLKGFNIVFSSSHISSAPQEDIDSTIINIMVCPSLGWEDGIWTGRGI